MTERDGMHISGKREDLCTRLKELVVQCEAEFEENQSDAFEGTILEGKLSMLRAQCASLEKGEEPEMMLARLRKKKAELEEAMEQEDMSPTFYWYDEHYYYKIYYGQNQACKIVTALLEEYCNGSEQLA